MSASGIVDERHEAMAAVNGWSREKPEGSAGAEHSVEPKQTVEERLAALEAKLKG